MNHLRVLVCHNKYQQHGGEDSVVESEITLLRNNGHTIEIYGRHNDEIPTIHRVALAGQSFWSRRTLGDISKCIAKFKPDVIHVHNTFPLISPTIYWAASRAGIPIVQTLHNFRLLCPQAMFLRDGKVCEDCLGHLPWRGIVRSCYRNSMAQSAVLSGMLILHRALGTYRNKVSRYIALNKYCRDKFIEGGIPANRIVIKPNFVDIPAEDKDAFARKGGVFVGRLSSEKGIDVLKQAMEILPTCNLKVIGSGPEEYLLHSTRNISRLGFLPREVIFGHMQKSAFLVMPSIWFENFPLTLVEAFACGLPVIASRIGALAELIEDGVTGLLFEAGNADELAKKILWATNNPDRMKEMGVNARNKYEMEFTSDKNYQQLIKIYADAIHDVTS